MDKEKKEITWRGFPAPGCAGSGSGGSLLDRLRAERAQRLAEVERKQVRCGRPRVGVGWRVGRPSLCHTRRVTVETHSLHGCPQTYSLTVRDERRFG
jgi:hypothetical protein